MEGSASYSLIIEMAMKTMRSFVLMIDPQQQKSPPKPKNFLKKKLLTILNLYNKVRSLLR